MVSKPALVTLLYLVIACSAVAFASDERHGNSIYCIEEQTLASALKQLSYAHNITIISRSEDVSSIYIKDTVCQYNLEKALTLLLADTALDYQKTLSGIILVPATPQEAKPAPLPIVEPDETIEVVSYRERYISGIKLKANSAIIGDFLSIGDINKLPAINTADLMTSLPGVNISREGGHGSRVSMRGLPSNFNLVEVNGIQLSGGIGSSLDSRGQKTRDRTVELSLLPSEFLGQINAVKHYTASNSEGGIAGNIHINTISPILNQENVLKAVVKGGRNSIAQDNSYSTMLDWNHGKEHTAVRIAALSSELNLQEQGTNTTRWRALTDEQQDVSALPENLQNRWQTGQIIVPRFNRYSIWSRTSEQQALLLAGRYDSDNARLKSTFIWNQLDEVRTENHLAISGKGTAPFAADSTILAAQINPQNELQYIQATQVPVSSESRYQDIQIDTKLFTLQGDINVGENGLLTAYLGDSNTTQAVPFSDKASLRLTSDISVDYRQKPHQPRLTFNSDTTSQALWRPFRVDRENFYTEMDLRKYKVTYTHDWDHSQSLTFGLEWRALRYDNQHPENNGLYSQRWQDTPVHFPSSLFRFIGDHPSQHWIGLDNRELIQYLGRPYTEFQRVSFEESSRTLEEETKNAFVEYHAEYPVPALFGLNILGESTLGVRRISQHITSKVLTGTQSQEINNTAHFYLPAFLTRFDFENGWQVKFGANSNITYPDIIRITGGVNINYDNRSAFVSNFDLSPYKATNFDISLEYYPDSDTHFAVSLYRKNLKNIPNPSALEASLIDVGLPSSALRSDSFAATPFNIIRDENNESTSLQGIELQFSSHLGKINPALDGLGATVSYTHNLDGEVEYRDSQGALLAKLPLTELSRKTVSLQTFYEQDNWGVRLSGFYRSQYVNLFDASTLRDESHRGYRPSFYLDMSAYLHINKHLTASLELFNLTNEQSKQYSDTPRRLYNATESGKSAYVTLQYVF